MGINFNILEKIREAQKLAIKENIKANSIQISKDFVKIPKTVTKNNNCVSITTPMICGLKTYIDMGEELPEEYAFALFQDDIEDTIVKSIEHDKAREILARLMEIYKDNPIVQERHLQDVFKNEWGIEIASIGEEN